MSKLDRKANLSDSFLEGFLIEDPKAPRIPNIVGHWYDCQIDRNAVEIAQFETRPKKIEIDLDGQSS